MEETEGARVKAPPPALAPPSRFSKSRRRASASSEGVRCPGSPARRLNAVHIKAARLRLSTPAPAARIGLHGTGR